MVDCCTRRDAFDVRIRYRRKPTRSLRLVPGQQQPPDERCKGTATQFKRTVRHARQSLRVDPRLVHGILNDINTGRSKGGQAVALGVLRGGCWNIGAARHRGNSSYVRRWAGW